MWLCTFLYEPQGKCLCWFLRLQQKWYICRFPVEFAIDTVSYLPWRSSFPPHSRSFEPSCNITKNNISVIFLLGIGHGRPPCHEGAYNRVQHGMEWETPEVHLFLPVFKNHLPNVCRLRYTRIESMCRSPEKSVIVSSQLTLLMFFFSFLILSSKVFL